MPLIGRRALMLFLLPLLLLLAAGRVEAQQNPLLGGGGDGEESAPPTAASPGLLHRLEGFIIATQRDVNREINRRLVAIRDGQGAGVILAGLLIAFLYGIFHALGPGHGKTVIVGYFLGRGGSIRRGVAMASWIALSHVVGAITVVVIVHAVLSEIYITPVEEMLSLRLVSYGAILLIGLVMLAMAIRSRGGEAGACHHHGHAHVPWAFPRDRARAAPAGHRRRLPALLRRDPDPGLRPHQRHPADGTGDDAVHRAGHGADLGRCSASPACWPIARSPAVSPGVPASAACWRCWARS